MSAADNGHSRSRASGTTRCNIRLDNEVLAFFRNLVVEQGGGNYQSEINRVLREHVHLRVGELETRVREIVRDEIAVRRRR